MLHAANQLDRDSGVKKKEETGDLETGPTLSVKERERKKKHQQTGLHTQNPTGKGEENRISDGAGKGDV